MFNKIYNNIKYISYLKTGKGINTLNVLNYIMLIPIYLLVIIGIAVGALTGITGASGVLVVVPTLLYLGLNFKEAIGSSLLVDIITTTTVTYVYFLNKNIDVKISLFFESSIQSGILNILRCNLNELYLTYSIVEVNVTINHY